MGLGWCQGKGWKRVSCDLECVEVDGVVVREIEEDVERLFRRLASLLAAEDIKSEV